MMQTAAVQKISEQNSPYKAMLDRAYMIGYTDAMNQERSHRRAARERRERKKYFAMQKLNGVALLIFTAVAIKILEGDATIAFITVPLGLSMLLSKEMLIINKYYWKCEEKAERGGAVMRFVIQGLKYDTDKMKKIANVKKWYKTNSLLVKAIYGNEEVGTTYDCELWRSEKGNWLLTHTEDYNTKVGHAITEEEAKSLLMRYAPDIYETEFEKIPEA
ncbi:MAG: hypothetical protein ACLR6H_05785 [Roseburia sp.]